MNMFDYDAPKEKSPTDWSGTIIGVMLLPVFFVFVFICKAELGFNVMLVLGLIMIAIRLRWRLRRHLWFWATIIAILALHVPLLFIIRWPQTNVPTIAYSLPLGIVDFLLISGALRLAERLFSNGSAFDGDLLP